jgi:hypothetical protein
MSLLGGFAATLLEFDVLTEDSQDVVEIVSDERDFW